MNDEPLIDLSAFLSDRPLLRRILKPLIIQPIERLLKVDQLNDTYESIKVRRKFAHEENFFDSALVDLACRIDITSGSLDSIPETGPVFVVSNHPFGAVDGLVLGSLLAARRSDSKLLANFLLGKMPEILPFLIPVNPFGTESAVRQNLSGLRAAGKWLADGHCVATFPSGFVSYYHPDRGEIRDAEWHENVARLARRNGATVVPMRIEGSNSALFQALGMIHPRLRTLALVREVYNKERRTVEVRIGSPIPPSRFTDHDSDKSLIRHFQMRSDVLHYKQTKQSKKPHATPLPVADRQPAETLIQEVEALPADALLCEQGVFQVYSATADQIPAMLEEIGRTRELTFRAVGEGTGKALDLDCFDLHYHHLFLWNNEACELVGAYRIGMVDKIVAEHGFAGLYSNVVFEYSDDAFDSLGPGSTLELGRSYIVPDYQKRGTSLFLLWRGIVKFIRKHPGYSKLFGAVSISDHYNPMSKALLIRFLKKHKLENGFENKIRARKDSNCEKLRGLRSFDYPGALPSLDEVSSLISEIEPDRKGAPTLLKHYLQLNGVILGVGVDQSFSDALDGFILVDLEKINPTVLQKYEGRTRTPET